MGYGACAGMWVKYGPEMQIFLLYFFFIYTIQVYMTVCAGPLKTMGCIDYKYKANCYCIYNATPK